MKDKIFPEELLLVSVEHHFDRYSKSNQWVYFTVISFLILSGLVFYFVKLEITVQSQGLIRPVTAKIGLTSLVSGRIARSNLLENQRIEKGQVLIIIESKELESRILHLEDQILKRELQKKDISQLLDYLKDKQKSDLQLQTKVFQSDLVQYHEEYFKTAKLYEKVSRDSDRYNELFKLRMISQKEMEEYNFKKSQVKSELKLLKNKKRLEWEKQLEEMNFELQKLNTEKLTQNEKLSLYEIRSPFNGTIQNITVVSNSYIQTGDQLAEITPDTSIIAEVYVHPNQVALLKADQNVHFGIHAFNYNQWGGIEGKVISISEDITMIEGYPFFKTICSLSKGYLTLRNGRKGYLRKGMTLSAHFRIEERTIFQLMYDKLEDWLIPEFGKIPANV